MVVKMKSKPKTCKAYKVVGIVDDRYISPYAYLENSSTFPYLRNYPMVQIDYEIGKKALPILGKLFVFKRLYRAKQACESIYIKSGLKLVIMSGVAENAEPVLRVASYRKNWERFWEDSMKCQKECVTNKTFLGTCSCDSFTPEKVVF
jgi:hypothetical protein